MTVKQLNPVRRQPIRAAKHEILKYCRYQLETLFVRASLAEPGTRMGLIRDWQQVKTNRDYILTMTFNRTHNHVDLLDLAA